MPRDLEERFDAAMMSIYVRALKEADYRASYYHQMLEELRGVATAKKLINSPKVSDGYTALLLLKRLDLTVEALIYDNKEWQPLFTEEELRIVTKRLEDYEYIPAKGR